MEHIGELVEEDESCNEEEHNKEKASARNAVFQKVLLLIPTDPGHESGENSKKDHGADTAGKIEGFEKKVWESKREQEGWNECKEAHSNALALFMFEFEAITEKVGEAERLREE